MLSISNFTVLHGDKKILSNLNLNIPPGSTHFLMGPNGSGKSTLTYSLMGHPRYTVATGSIKVDGEDITQFPTDQRAKKGLFLALQHPCAIPGLTVFSFLKESYQAITDKHISVPALQKLVREKMAQLALDESFLERQVHENFSGGEKKLLEMLQFLLFKPRIAIFDEIDAGLDLDGLERVAQAIKKAKQEDPELSIILITHNRRILDYLHTDAVHVMMHGALVASGDMKMITALEAKGYDTWYADYKSAQKSP